MHINIFECFNSIFDDNNWISTLFALLVISVHLAEGIYVFLLCDEMRFSFASAAKWFLQTVIVGYPSLTLLKQYVHERRKN
ncbi:hypothetical protein DICVIV_12618 [Dictyocaulus viviparus]|uniref:Transmembrane protein 107 n=1 Tax=Dictyocaulus viviparus TaxID=29172 RepID=A0A0D8XCB7_DICVI|nr:hypothetical protein DICVIV_12618 [Dictyocaulus viviparus]